MALSEVAPTRTSRSLAVSQRLPLSLRLLRLKSEPLVYERALRLERLLSVQRLTNAGIWFAIIQDRGHLTYNEFVSVVGAYKKQKELHPQSNVPLADLFVHSGLKRAPRDKVYEKICFNYEAASDRSVIEWAEYDLQRLREDGAIARELKGFVSTDIGSNFFYREYVRLKTGIRKNIIPLLGLNEVIKPDVPCKYYDHVHPTVAKVKS